MIFSPRVAPMYVNASAARGIVTAAARDKGVVIPLGAVVAQLVASLRAQGHGDLDHSALLKVVEQLSGRSKP